MMKRVAQTEYGSFFCQKKITRLLADSD